MLSLLFSQLNHFHMKNTINNSILVDAIQNGTTVPDFHNYDGKYHRMIQGHRNFNPEMFFYLRTKQPPKINSYSHVDAIMAIDAICDAYHLDKRYAITNSNVNLEK